MRIREYLAVVAGGDLIRVKAANIQDALRQICYHVDPGEKFDFYVPGSKGVTHFVRNGCLSQSPAKKIRGAR